MAGSEYEPHWLLNPVTVQAYVPPLPVLAGAGVALVGVGEGEEVVGTGPGVVGDRLGLVPVGLGAGEEDTPARPGLVGEDDGQCRCPAPRHDVCQLEAEMACMAGTAAPAARADAAPMAATARTVWARENLIIGKQPFWSAGRLPYAYCGGGCRRFTSYVSIRKSCDYRLAGLRLPAQTRARSKII